LLSAFAAGLGPVNERAGEAGFWAERPTFLSEWVFVPVTTPKLVFFISETAGSANGVPVSTEGFKAAEFAGEITELANCGRVNEALDFALCTSLITDSVTFPEDSSRPGTSSV
jgi:hypothetical protein